MAKFPTILLVSSTSEPRGKGVGMLVVSLKGVKFGFWSHLGCFGQNTIIFSRKGLFKDCAQTGWIEAPVRRNIQKLYIFNSFYLLDPCNQSLKWSLLRVKKRGWAMPRLVFFRGLIQNLRRASPPLSCEGSPRDLTPSQLTENLEQTNFWGGAATIYGLY